MLASLAVSWDAPPVAAVVVIALVCFQCGARRSVRVGLLSVAAVAVACQIATGFQDFPDLEILFFTAAPGGWAGRCACVGSW